MEAEAKPIMCVLIATVQIQTLSGGHGQSMGAARESSLGFLFWCLGGCFSLHNPFSCCASSCALLTEVIALGCRLGDGSNILYRDALSQGALAVEVDGCCTHISPAPVTFRLNPCRHALSVYPTIQKDEGETALFQWFSSALLFQDANHSWLSMGKKCLEKGLADWDRCTRHYTKP